jgi:hypothetical protein
MAVKQVGARILLMVGCLALCSALVRVSEERKQGIHDIVNVTKWALI